MTENGGIRNFEFSFRSPQENIGNIAFPSRFAFKKFGILTKYGPRIQNFLSKKFGSGAEYLDLLKERQLLGVAGAAHPCVRVLVVSGIDLWFPVCLSAATRSCRPCLSMSVQ
jgi:hypothetical protein